jgi:hypothetical protein
MARAKVHYEVDCFYPDEKAFDGFCKESHVIKATSDEQAKSEAVRMEWRKPHHYHVRAVTWQGDRVIFKSPEKGPDLKT